VSLDEQHVAKPFANAEDAAAQIQPPGSGFRHHNHRRSTSQKAVGGRRGMMKKAAALAGRGKDTARTKKKKISLVEILVRCQLSLGDCSNSSKARVRINSEVSVSLLIFFVAGCRRGGRAEQRYAIVRLLLASKCCSFLLIFF
jgi:hypothetical protein